MNKSKLIIVCGLPGSGKSTLASQIAKKCNGIIMSADEWMKQLGVNLHDSELRTKIEMLQFNVSKDILNSGGAVIIEWGTWAKEERDALRLMGREVGARVELYPTPNLSPEELYERISKRGMENPPITFDTVKSWFDIYQDPSNEELALYDQCHYTTSEISFPIK